MPALEQASLEPAGPQLAGCYLITDDRPKRTVVSGQFWLLPARHAVRPSARSIPLRSSCQRRLPSAASSVFARPESKRVTHEAKLKKSFSPSNFPASVGSTVEKPIVHPAKSLSKIGSRMI